MGIVLRFEKIEDHRHKASALFPRHAIPEANPHHLFDLLVRMNRLIGGGGEIIKDKTSTRSPR